MASLENKGISGKIGNLIYYQRNGKQYAKAAETKEIKQTDATKASAGKFALASKISKNIRLILPDHFTALNDLDTRNRLTSFINSWLQSMPASTNGQYESITNADRFEFNEKNPLKKRLKIPLKVKWNNVGKLSVYVPMLDSSKSFPLPPGRSKYAELWVGVASGLVNDDNTVTFDGAIINYRSKETTEQHLEFSVSALPGSFCVVVAGMQYVIGVDEKESKVTDRDWLSARILDAVYKAD